MRHPRRTVRYLVALACSTTVLAEARGQLPDSPIRPRPQTPPPARIETVDNLEPCRVATADGTVTLGAGDSSQASVVRHSFSSAYFDRSRSCRRFVVDVAVPGTHVTPSGHRDAIEFSADGPHYNHKQVCESTVVNAVFYQRTDGAAFSQGELNWNEGSFSAAGSVRLRGKWSQFDGCMISPESGAFPVTTVPSGSSMRKVLRIAVEAHREEPDGNREGLSVTAGARHQPLPY